MTDFEINQDKLQEEWKGRKLPTTSIFSFPDPSLLPFKGEDGELYVKYQPTKIT